MRWICIPAALLLSGCAQIAESQGARVADLKVRDAVTDYETASRKGDPLDMCVKARLVAGAYEDARETTSAEAWTARAKEACQLAADVMGIRRPQASD